MSFDKLFDVKNLFYIGNFQGAVSEGQKLVLKAEDEKLARDIYVFKSYLALNKATIVLAEIPQGTKSETLKGIRRLAEYATSKNQPKFLEDIEEEAQSSSEPLARVAYGVLYLQAHNPEKTLQLLHNVEHLEARGASIHALLAMNRPDVAIKELARMSEQDEDATLTQLATAWVNMFIGKEKLKDAFYIYQELIDKYGATPYLLIGKSNALIAQGQGEEAEEALEEVLQRDPNSVEAMINKIRAQLHNDKKKTPLNFARKQLVQIAAVNPNHPFVQNIERARVNFEKLKQH
ncbi:unnamed protein product, partial [Mesorhabditis spiculigera]